MNWITQSALNWIGAQAKPCLGSEFDKQFSPVGKTVRDELVKQMIIRVSHRGIIEIVQPEERRAPEDISRANHIIAGIIPSNFTEMKDEYRNAIIEELTAHRANGYRAGYEAGLRAAIEK